MWHRFIWFFFIQFYLLGHILNIVGAIVLRVWSSRSSFFQQHCDSARPSISTSVSFFLWGTLVPTLLPVATPPRALDYKIVLSFFCTSSPWEKTDWEKLSTLLFFLYVFCCCRFHVLSEFDEGKCSYWRRLTSHNEHRRKLQLDAQNPATLNSRSSSPMHTYAFHMHGVAISLSLEGIQNASCNSCSSFLVLVLVLLWSRL